MHKKNKFNSFGNILVLYMKLQNVRDKVVHFYGQDKLFEIDKYNNSILQIVHTYNQKISVLRQLVLKL